ncbi:MAG: serine/threonine protein kinase [Planctomycetes bacterium]|nr:serine/threonine protein kinase [Planctomycetota bacterium]
MSTPAHDPTHTPEPSPPEDSVRVERLSIEGIFIEALSKTTPEARREFLDHACGTDADRRQRVQALLQAYDDAGSFLQQPAGDWRNPPPPPVVEEPAPQIPNGLLTPSDRPDCLGTLGPYEIREFIGRGGMGIVLKALDPMLNRIVAIKALAPELAALGSFRKRFAREARAAAAVSHPHIVTIHAVDDTSNPPFLVMECIIGRSLQQKIDQTGSLKLTEILRIGTQMAEGLAAAHKQGLVHRDIKPANILLENGVERVKITDFGLARSVDDLTLTRTGEVSGTPQFMSPEQALGQRVDHRSDLFSLGCVLYAMCSGRPPFRGDTMAAVIRRICDEAPQPLHEINPDIPAWLIQTIERLLDKDPARRIQTAAEVAEILSGQLAQVQYPPVRYAATGAPPPSPPRVRRPALPVPRAVKEWWHWVMQPTWISDLRLLLGLVLTGFLTLRFLSPRAEEPILLVLLALGLGLPGWLFTRRARDAGSSSGRKWRFIGAGALAVWLGGMLGAMAYPMEREFPFLLVLLTVAASGIVVWIYKNCLQPRPQSITPTLADGESPPAAPAPVAPAPADAGRRSELLPWKVLGWLVVGFVVLVVAIPAVGILIPVLMKASATQMGTVEFGWDPQDSLQVTQIEARLQGGSHVNVWIPEHNPYRIQLSPGIYQIDYTIQNRQDPRAVPIRRSNIIYVTSGSLTRIDPLANPPATTLPNRSIPLSGSLVPNSDLPARASE